MYIHGTILQKYTFACPLIIIQLISCFTSAPVAALSVLATLLVATIVFI